MGWREVWIRKQCAEAIRMLGYLRIRGTWCEFLGPGTWVVGQTFPSSPCSRSQKFANVHIFVSWTALPSSPCSRCQGFGNVLISKMSSKNCSHIHISFKPMFQVPRIRKCLIFQMSSADWFLIHTSFQPVFQVLWIWMCPYIQTSCKDSSLIHSCPQPMFQVPRICKCANIQASSEDCFLWIRRQSS